MKPREVEPIPCSNKSCACFVVSKFVTKPLLPLLFDFITILPLIRTSFISSFSLFTIAINNIVTSWFFFFCVSFCQRLVIVYSSHVFFIVYSNTPIVLVVHH